jgi:hypothetical protein
MTRAKVAFHVSAPLACSERTMKSSRPTAMSDARAWPLASAAAAEPGR